MKRIRMRHVVVLLAAIAMVGIGTSAMAYRGWMNSEGGYGDCPGGGCDGVAANLTEEQRTQLRESRQAFFEDTEALRDQLRDKADELHTVLAADSVDAAAAAELQTEISGIKAELDQKRLAHRIEMQQLFPEREGGPRYKGGRGFGRRGGGCGRW